MRTRLCDQPVVRIPKGRASAASPASAPSQASTTGSLGIWGQGEESPFILKENPFFCGCKSSKSQGRECGQPRWGRHIGGVAGQGGLRRQQVNPKSQQKQGARAGWAREVGGRQTEVRFGTFLLEHRRGASRTHPRSRWEPAPRPPRSPGRTRGGSMRPGGARPRAPAPRSPSPCARRRCPAARAPRCRSAQAGRPVRPAGGAALLRVRRAPPRAPRARDREGDRPPPPVSPPAEGQARRPRWAAGRGAAVGGRLAPRRLFLSLSPRGARRAPRGGAARLSPTSDARGRTAVALGRSPGVDSSRAPVLWTETRTPSPPGPAIGVVPASLRGTPPSARRDGPTGTGLSARSVRACPPWGRAGRLCPRLLHPLSKMKVRRVCFTPYMLAAT